MISQKKIIENYADTMLIQEISHIETQQCPKEPGQYQPSNPSLVICAKCHASLWEWHREMCIVTEWTIYLHSRMEGAVPCNCKKKIYILKLLLVTVLDWTGVLM